MNIPQVAGRLRARIVQFSGELSAVAQGDEEVFG